VQNNQEFSEELVALMAMGDFESCYQAITRSKFFIHQDNVLTHFAHTIRNISVFL